MYINKEIKFITEIPVELWQKNGLKKLYCETKTTNILYTYIQHKCMYVHIYNNIFFFFQRKESTECIVAPLYDLYKNIVTTCFSGKYE